MLASARSGLEAAHAPFRTGLLEAVQRLRQQRGAVVLAALAGGDAGVHRETDDVAVWHRGIGMLFERRPEPIRLADSDRAIGFRDDQAKPAVADSSQGVDTAGLCPGHTYQIAQDASQSRFTAFSA